MSASRVILAVGEVSPVRIGSLFSGYGGLDMAASSVLGGQVAWHVEYDKAPSRILAHHYSDVPNYGDVTAVDFTTIEPVDVLTGGYPCQPFSHAGLRKGTNDDRHLWPHVLRAIREMGPRLAILENVRGHLSLGFDTVLADLADLGWSARWGVVRASDAGAPHQRARLFIVAYPECQRHDGRRECGAEGPPKRWGPYAQGLADHAADAQERPRRSGVGEAEAERGQGVNQPRGRPTANASGQRHGRRQDAGMVGRVGTSSDVLGRQASAPREVASDRGTQGFHWGEYGPAIARWEHVIGRPAPAPTEPRADGVHRLSPRFTEWMMGLPDGHVADPAIGISRTDQLKALGNGVVPQQAALALDVLLKGTPYDIRQGLATV